MIGGVVADWGLVLLIVALVVLQVCILLTLIWLPAEISRVLREWYDDEHTDEDTDGSSTPER